MCKDTPNIFHTRCHVHRYNKQVTYAYASGTATTTHLHVSADSFPPRPIFPQVLAANSLKKLALLPPERRLRALLEEEKERAQEQEQW
jgi:hypothetical protein